MDSTIIDFIAYKKQNLTQPPHVSHVISAELITEIQILIQRLRDSNPIKPTSTSASCLDKL